MTDLLYYYNDQYNFIESHEIPIELPIEQFETTVEYVPVEPLKTLEGNEIPQQQEIVRISTESPNSYLGDNGNAEITGLQLLSGEQKEEFQEEEIQEEEIHYIPGFNQNHFEFKYYPKQNPMTIETLRLFSNPTLPSKTPRDPNSENAQLYINHRNYQAYQQAILLALLNKYACVAVAREKKRSNVTIPFFTITHLAFSEIDVIDFQTFIQERCKCIKESDIKAGVGSKTASRRYKTNRINEVLHVLFDYNRLCGEILETSQTRPKSGIIQTETLETLFVEGFKITKDQIKVCGEMINKKISSIVNGSHYVFVQGELYSILLQFISHSNSQQQQ